MEIIYDKIVKFNNGIINGKGAIAGIATIGDAIIGRSIIIEMIESNVSWKDYPYTHACFFESQLSDNDE